jgi:hypothetical protein
VCNERWPEDAAECHCGYDFTTRDPRGAITRLEREARRGNSVWRRGLFAMVCLPVTFALPQLVLAGMLGMAQCGLAALWIVQGLARADAANRKLAAAKQLVALPAARIVQR